MHFDSLPAEVREAIFLFLGPSDLNTCLDVCKAWRSYIMDQMMRSERNKNDMATHRKIFGKIVPNQEVAVDSTWMLVSKRSNKLVRFSLPRYLEALLLSLILVK